MTPAIKPMSILIADDHEMVRTGMRMMLERFYNDDTRVSIKEAKDGEEALSKAIKDHFDVVLLDFNMPKLKGEEVISRLLSYKPTQKIIVVSNYDEESYINSSLKLGAKAYVQKDIEAGELFYCIGKVMDGEIYLPPHIFLTIWEKKMKPSGNEKLIDKYKISKRELQIMNYLGKEMSNEEVGVALGISKRTVDAHRQNIMRKIDLKNNTALIKFILQNNLVKD